MSARTKTRPSSGMMLVNDVPRLSSGVPAAICPINKERKTTGHFRELYQSFSQALSPRTKLPARTTIARSISHHNPARASSLEIPKIEATADRTTYRRLLRRILSRALVYQGAWSQCSSPRTDRSIGQALPERSCRAFPYKALPELGRSRGLSGCAGASLCFRCGPTMPNPERRIIRVEYPGMTLGRAHTSASGQDVTTAGPEPGTWLMMILGLGAIGVAMRKRPSSAIVCAPAKTTRQDFVTDWPAQSWRPD